MINSHFKLKALFLKTKLISFFPFIKFDFWFLQKEEGACCSWRLSLKLMLLFYSRFSSTTLLFLRQILLQVDQICFFYGWRNRETGLKDRMLEDRGLSIRNDEKRSITSVILIKQQPVGILSSAVTLNGIKTL